MDGKSIRQSALALIQEVAHYHMVNAHKSMSLGDVQDRLESYYPINNEMNLTYVTLHTTDIVGFMGSGYDQGTIGVASITIKGKVEIMATRDKVEIKQILADDEIAKVYDYKKLIDDVHAAIGTGREVDLDSYDLAAIIRDIDKEK